MHYHGILEEELKNKVANDWFRAFDATVIEGKIDFALYPKHPHGEPRPLLWAEAKTGNYPLPDMLAQLVLTIGKARTFDHVLPPPFLGALDGQKIAFLPYEPIAHIFHQSDFNWNVAPSDHSSREFVLVRQQINDLLDTQAISVFDYDLDAAALKAFIHGSLSQGTGEARIRIDKNNFYPIYLRWLEAVKPNIAVDWADLKQHGILDSDFFLADLFVDDRDTVSVHDDISIRESLFVVFQSAGYRIAKENLKGLFDAVIAIKNLQAYQQFWAKYKRPPLQEYQEYIITRRDLLVPQDIRERKGAFFTPRQWVELSQQYLADYLGPNWQEEYYVWDCAAGTGNLLAGLTNPANIYASTLDQADVNAMRDRIEHGALLLRGQVFQFDFLNDEFKPLSQGGKLPDSLYAIISDPEMRKKLVIYINPPYAEATTKSTVTGTGSNKGGTATGNRTWEKYKPLIKAASNELYAQFLIRIYKELSGVTLANFSTLKNLQASNFSDFRQAFQPKLERLFLVPANTFDNVKGQFPIGFHIWNSSVQAPFQEIMADVFPSAETPPFTKLIYSYTGCRYINQWIATYPNDSNSDIGYLRAVGNDFQNHSGVFISKTYNPNRHDLRIGICSDNLLHITIYLTVRHCIPATWLNDRDQFLYPHDGWQQDAEFLGNCLAFTIFHNSNNIRSSEGPNHWIPFREIEVGARERFASHFMTDFMAGRLKPETSSALLKGQDKGLIPSAPMVFSNAATAVFDAGRALWRYYHAQPGANANASYYDIREHFQGRNDKGRMNPSSPDATYSALLATLREAMGALAAQIEPKVYQYGFLKGEPEGL